MRADFVSGHLAVFNSDNCIDCAQCLAFCRFDAIKQAAPCEYPVIEQLCEGCAVCVKLCPELAFDFVPRHCGEYYRSRTRFGTMIHAELTPGAETPAASSCSSSRRQPKAAQADGAEIILSDGTPGIGCPSSARSRAQASSARSSGRRLEHRRLQATCRTCTPLQAADSRHRQQGRPQRPKRRRPPCRPPATQAPKSSAPFRSRPSSPRP